MIVTFVIDFSSYTNASNCDIFTNLTKCVNNTNCSVIPNIYHKYKIIIIYKVYPRYEVGTIIR